MISEYAAQFFNKPFPDNACTFRESDRAQIQEKGTRFNFYGHTVYALKCKHPFTLVIEGRASCMFDPGDYVIYEPANGDVFAMKASTFEPRAKEIA